MREDVRKFAEKMDAVMVEKEGDCKTPDTFISCMGQIQFQLRKFEEHPFPDKQRAQRILLHIANWAMISERKLMEGK